MTWCGEEQCDGANRELLAGVSFQFSLQTILSLQAGLLSFMTYDIVLISKFLLKYEVQSGSD